VAERESLTFRSPAEIADAFGLEGVRRAAVRALLEGALAGETRGSAARAVIAASKNGETIGRGCE